MTGTTRRSQVAKHPKYELIVSRLQNGEGEEIAPEYGLSKDALGAWWRRHKTNLPNVEAATPEAEQVSYESEAELARAVRVERRARESAERRARVLEAQLRDLEAEAADWGEIVELVRGADNRTPAVPDWLIPARPSRQHHGTVNLVLSDLHLDEVVKPEAVMGMNAFDRRIAEMRLQRTFSKAIALPRDYMAGIKYDGIVVHLAGDTFSGDIHAELARTNEATPLETLLYWLDPMVAGIRMLVEEYGKVHIVSVPGNHDRTTHKPVAKGRVETSYHYLFSKLLEREFRGNNKVTWNIPLSPDALTTIYNTRILTTHGDQFKGGNGIGGVLIPILRGDAKKRQRQSAVGEPYDLMVLGHFHQYIAGPGVLINGSMKGYDEYAFQNNFSYEAAQQALFLVTPEHGPSFHMPIQCSDRAKERW